MTACGYIPLHHAVSLVYRLIRLKRLAPVKVRHGMHAAILNGDLQVHWMDPAAYNKDALIYFGEPLSVVPAWAFENAAAAQTALVDSRLAIDPYLAVLSEHRDQQCVVERDNLRWWLNGMSIDAFSAPLPERAHDWDHRLQTTVYRAPSKNAYIPLSAALSWADRRVTLTLQDFVNADVLTHDRDARDLRHAAILHDLLEAARNNQLPIMARPFQHEDDDARYDLQALTGSDLENFQRYDPSIEALIPGNGIAWSECEVASDDQAKRTDGFRDVCVGRNALLKLFKPNRETSTVAAERYAERWLAQAFAADPDCKLTKAQFLERVRGERPMTERAFNRAWDKVAPVSRRTAGRPKSR